MTKNTRNQGQNSYAGENCHDRAEQQSKNRSTNAQNSQTRNKSTNKAGNKTTSGGFRNAYDEEDSDFE